MRCTCFNEKSDLYRKSGEKVFFYDAFILFCSTSISIEYTHGSLNPSMGELEGRDGDFLRTGSPLCFPNVTCAVRVLFRLLVPPSRAVARRNAAVSVLQAPILLRFPACSVLGQRAKGNEYSL